MDNPETYERLATASSAAVGVRPPVVEDASSVLSLETAVELIGRFQDAALEPSLWQSALERLCAAFGGQYASMTLTTARPPVLVLREMHVGMTPTADMVELFSALQEQDPRVQWALDNFGRAGASNINVGMERMRNSAVYREILRGLDIEYTLMLPEMIDDRIACTITIDRGRAQAPFQRSDVAALQMLRPSFARAMRTQLRIGKCETLRDDLRNALDRLPVGVLIVDSNYKVCFSSRTADTMLAANDGLSVQRGELQAEHYAPARRLQSALAQALGAARGEVMQSEDTVTVKRHTGRRDFELLVAPLPADRLEIFPRQPAALVILSDPEQSQPLPWKLVQQLYGLSPAESRLSVALAKGWPLKDYAKRTEISVETARSQLKAAMSKTQTHRQVELIRLLLTGPAAYALLDPPADGA